MLHTLVVLWASSLVVLAAVLAVVVVCQGTVASVKRAAARWSSRTARPAQAGRPVSGAVPARAGR